MDRIDSVSSLEDLKPIDKSKKTQENNVNTINNNINNNNIDSTNNTCNNANNIANNSVDNVKDSSIIDCEIIKDVVNSIVNSIVNTVDKTVEKDSVDILGKRKLNDISKTDDVVKTKSKKLCYALDCRIKLNIVNTFKCRCGNNYCGIHRYADKHNCTFDYVKYDRKILEKNNEKIIVPKVDKI